MHQSSPYELEKDVSKHPLPADAPSDHAAFTKSLQQVQSDETISHCTASPTCQCHSHQSSLPESLSDPDSRHKPESLNVSLKSDIQQSPVVQKVGYCQSTTRSKEMVSTDEIEKSLDDWRGLDVYADSPLFEAIWFHEAMRAFESDGPSCVTAIMTDDRWTAVAPLVERSIRGVRRRCFAGSGELHEPADFVADDPESLHRLLEVLLHEGRPILLERVLCQSPSIDAVNEIFQRRAIVIKRPQAPCPFIELNDTWLEPESHLNSGRRSDFRRARRKAEKLGEVSIQIIAPDVDGLNDLLDEAFEIEGKSWKGDAKTALIHDAKRARFFQEYARRAAEEGILRVCFLKIEGQSAAMQLAIEHKQGFWLLKVGYDDRFRSCSPGLLLMRETIRYAAEKELKSYEFLGVAEDWTAVWTKAEHQTVSLWIYPISWCGLSALAMDLSSKLFSRWSRS